MRFSAAIATLAAAASSVAAGWLPPLLSPKAGDVYANGDNITITWDTTGYNSSANAYGKFLLGYTSPTDPSETVVAQFYGRAVSYGDEVLLWNGTNSINFTIDLVDSFFTEEFGEKIWSITEFPLGGDQQTTGLFTVTA